jgi:hypothetical protein
MIIDSTYFYGRLTIAQKDTPAVAQTLTEFIAKHESKYLEKILGYKTAKDFTSAIDASPAQKWVDLRDGKEFQDVAQQWRKWIGFKNSAKESPIANYVYYQWMANEVSNTTGIGEKKLIFANSINYSPSQKMCYAWNEMIEWHCILQLFLEVNKADYPDYILDWQNEFYYKINDWGL